MSNDPKPFITPGRILGALAIFAFAIWLSGGFCPGKKRSTDPDRDNGATASCRSDGDCPAGQRCFRYETGSPENPRTSGYCARR